MLQLPTVQDIEKNIISAFLRPENIRRIIEMGVTSKMFTNLKYVEIFEAGVEMIRQEITPDAVLIMQQLKNKNSEITPIEITELYGAYATFVNLKQYIATLREYYGRRNLIVNLENIKINFANPEKSAIEVFESLKREYQKNEDFLKPQRNLPTTEQANNYLETLNRIQNPKTNGTGVIVRWGIGGMDKICPLQRQQIFVLGGGVNTGKTRFILSDLIGNLLLQNPQPMVIFSKENPNRILWDGLVSILSGVSAYNLNVANGLTQDQQQEVFKAVNFLKAKADFFRLYGKGEYKPTPSGICEKVRHVLDYTNGTLAKVAVDYIQNHQPDGKSFSAVEKTEKFVQELSDGIGEFPVALVLLSQLNRDKLRGNTKLTINDLKGSSAIEQEADYIAFLQKISDAKNSTFPINFYAVKSRGGTSLWSERILFNSKTGWMERLMGEHEYA